MFDGSAAQPGVMLGGDLAASGAHSGGDAVGQPQPPAFAPVGTVPVPPPASRNFPMATAWTCPDPSAIPPRQFLHARHYIRGVVSATIAPTSVGKSQHAITDAIDMVLNAGLTVWYINLEDDKVELDRRVAATLVHRSKRPADLGGRLYISGSDGAPLVIAKADRDVTEVDAELCSALVQQIVLKQVDVLIIDPFISAHQVSENNNNAIDRVVKALAAIARGCNIAIEVVHHARKGNGKETTMDDGRGASALTAAVRSARVLNQMTPAEAAKCGIPDNERKSYVRVAMEKSNLGKLAACPQWFRLVSVTLPNGDDIGVVEGWNWPATDAASTHELADILAAQEIIAKHDYKLRRNTGQEWVGLHIARVFGLDHIATNETQKKQMVEIIKTLVNEGWFKVVKKLDGNSLPRDFVAVGRPVVVVNLPAITAPPSVPSVPSVAHQAII